MTGWYPMHGWMVKRHARMLKAWLKADWESLQLYDRDTTYKDKERKLPTLAVCTIAAWIHRHKQKEDFVLLHAFH